MNIKVLVWKGEWKVEAMWNSENVGTEQEVHHTLCALLYQQALEVFYLAMTQVIPSSPTTLFNFPSFYNIIPYQNVSSILFYQILTSRCHLWSSIVHQRGL